MHSSPFRHSTCSPKGAFACDLHALATPPAFDLSQDQTRHLIIDRPALGSAEDRIRSSDLCDSGGSPLPDHRASLGQKLSILIRRVRMSRGF